MPHCDYCQRDDVPNVRWEQHRNSAGDTVTVNWCDECQRKIDHVAETMTPCANIGCGNRGQEFNGVSLCPTHAEKYLRGITASWPKASKPRKPATVQAKPAKPARTIKPRIAPTAPNVPCMVPASDVAPAPPAPVKPEQPAPLPVAPMPATALPSNPVDWARRARRQGWAVLFGMPADTMRAYAARETYLVSYPEAVAALAKIESSRYWLKREAV